MAPFSIPAGCIYPWWGLLAEIPASWAVCDGENDTPDLRDRVGERGCTGHLMKLPEAI